MGGMPLEQGIGDYIPRDGKRLGLLEGGVVLYGLGQLAAQAGEDVGKWGVRWPI
jgi:hypothetical protein